ncbi:MAG: cell filamentation protein Fic [Actinobacteria bacterium HGW-Actinobacteria-7]|jgi:Fic family protein|nr:MAG: cell filamentation protein Fic [Actinobacteria bacterium HGW-Actinobacteria-7]
MRGSFTPGYLDRLALPPDAVRSISELGVHRGRQELFGVQFPQALEVLREVAVIQSVESSNRIEGVTAAPQRLVALVAQKTTPVDRSEQEIAGYRDALSFVHANAGHIWPLTNGVVLQLNRSMNSFMASPGGAWKPADNDIVEWTPEGEKRVRFTPVHAHLVDDAMIDLHVSLRELWEGGRIDPLVLSAAYALDFLCVHPFLDGNGRMSRLLTLVLTYQAGLEVGRYISLERIVEDSRESYYEALALSSKGWHEAQHDLLPWLEYFLGVLLVAYREFEARVGAVQSPKGAKRELVVDCIRHLPIQFQFADVTRSCPGVSRPTIDRALRQLRQSGEIRLLRAGRDAQWERTPS